ncbi:type VII secretion target [Actinocrispum wychmicini]|uniref:Excreted virulence factor EspC (Type VII ESX diderm) n=1 Tax=Actinocrispum wychmicini TaxID=1213861 RepID=A0A4V2S701_9PSEU|nr:type VII secretion target [Actinocrispum wychmicini]TCO58040.1 excreted virulence factor EspC (type VII ESX diderm) [Actinocrispum wychmicini]
MSFEVDPDALDRFAALLGRYAEDATALKNHIQEKAAFANWSDWGLLLSQLAPTHDLAVQVSTERANLMWTIGTRSSSGVTEAASWYRSTDQESAADLDTTYAAVTPQETLDDRFTLNSYGMSGDELNRFADRSEPTALLQNPTVDWNSLAPDVNPIDTAFRNVTGVISGMNYVREFCKDTFGHDPFGIVAEFLAGDWQDFAKVAVVWHACGDAVAGMAENLRFSDESLASVWSGNAADAAIDYFQQFHSATQAEIKLYNLLYSNYCEYVKIACHAAQILNDTIDSIMDKVVTVLVAIAAGYSADGVLGAIFGGIVGAILEAIGFVVNVCTFALDAARLVQIVESYSNLSYDIPPSELDALSYVGGSSLPGYHHPASVGP